MKQFLFAFLVFGFFTALPAYAQPAQPAGAAPKIVMIDTGVFFDEKSGVTRILTAAKSVTAEFAGKKSELQQISTRIQLVEKEVAVFRDNVAKGIPFDEKAAAAKVEELDRLKREGKFKEDEANALIQKRQNELVGPEYSAALKVLGEYVTSKGYGMVFDVAKDQGRMLMFATPQYDITKDFITFYNARPPTAINSVPK